MFSLVSNGSFTKTASYLQKLAKINILAILNNHGSEGVSALRSATPVESSRASNSWDFRAGRDRNGYFIVWTNSDVENGFPVAIMLQYGYGTGTGGYVQGRDYINPAIRPIFDRIANDVWKAVTSV